MGAIGGTIIGAIVSRRGLGIGQDEGDPLLRKRLVRQCSLTQKLSTMPLRSKLVNERYRLVSTVMEMYLS
jgi:hypothetical protein